MEDFFLKAVGTIACVIFIIVVGLAATGSASISFKNTETGKEKRWGKKD